MIVTSILFWEESVWAVTIVICGIEVSTPDEGIETHTSRSRTPVPNQLIDQ